MSQPFKDAVGLCKTIMRNGYDAYVINARLQKSVLARAGAGSELAMDISTELDLEGLRRLFPNIETCAEEGVTIELHPDDLALVVKAYGGEEECKKRGWTLIAEPALQRGDLQLQSRTSSIDLLLEQRIEQLLRNFMRTNADLLP